MSSPPPKAAAFQWRIRQWFPDLPPKVEEQLKTYLTELIFFNGRMNLISPRTEPDADLIHLADGILGCQIILRATARKEIYDIGSGNGVPGIIMACLAADRTIRLVDSDARKIEFLKHCIGRLGLKNCTATQVRVEDLAEASIQCCMSRGLASVSKTILMLRKPSAPGCEVFHLKGDSWASEVAEIPSQILASWEPKHVADYSLPAGSTKYTIIVTLRKSR